jgi:hypothetical protein
MRTFAALSVASLALAFAACSGSAKTSGFGDQDGGGGDNGGGDDNGGGNDASYGSDIGMIGSHSEGGTTTTCSPNPLNYDVPGNNCDDDDDGMVDNVIVCDQGLANTGDAPTFVKAMGLCQTADATHWGVVSATYSDGFNRTNPPAAGQHGIMSTFGNVIVPREGQSLGVLSSGGAGATDSDMGPQFKGGKNGMQPAIDTEFGAGQNYAPPGYPLSTSACPVMQTTYDAINVSVQIKVPANAQGFSVDFDFWSGEWPDYVCTEYNDSFVAMLNSQAVMGGVLTNISKDMMGNPINVNAGFFDHCTPGAGLGCQGGNQSTGTSTCTGGVGELAGTGFDNPIMQYCPGVASTSGGATGWLTSTENAQPGETLTIQFIIWDTGDWNYDSSVLLDNWKWVPTPPSMTGTMVAPPQ